MECHLKIRRSLTWAPMRKLICKQTGCLKLYWANGLLYITVPHLIWGVPETQRIYLKAVITRIEVHQGFHILWPLHLDNAHQPHSLQQCHGHPKSDGGAQQCGGLVKADSPAGTGAYRQWKSLIYEPMLGWIWIHMDQLSTLNQWPASFRTSKPLRFC